MPEDIPAAHSPAELKCRDDGQWVTIKKGSEWPASGRYCFVRLKGRFYVCKSSENTGHLELSQGKPVEYAGEVHFGKDKKRGILSYWNNSSGHYKPDPSAASAAVLPLDLFREYLFF